MEFERNNKQPQRIEQISRIPHLKLPAVAVKDSILFAT